MSEIITCPHCDHKWSPEYPYLKGKELVDAARELARVTHAAHFRTFGKDKGLSYFDTHLTRVYQKLCALHPGNYEAHAVGWLHDSKEDFPNKINLDLLKGMRFPPSVINGIWAVSRVPGEDYTEYLKRAFMDEIGRCVKWCDMDDNAADGPVKYKIAMELFKAWSGMKPLLKIHMVPESIGFMTKPVWEVVGDYLRGSAPESSNESNA
jgi:hypothetical protein